MVFNDVLNDHTPPVVLLFLDLKGFQFATELEQINDLRNVISLIVIVLVFLRNDERESIINPLHPNPEV